MCQAAALWALEGTYNAVQEGLQPVLIPLMSFSSEWPVGSSAQDVGVTKLGSNKMHLHFSHLEYDVTGLSM